MAYVEGELGIKIEEIMNESDELYDLGEFKKSIDELCKAWELLPNDKYQYDESFLIIWEILAVAIQIHDTESMSKWVNHIFYADPERGDTGEREMWAGRVAYELGDEKKALEYISLANKKSKGRCFGDNDEKYKEFWKKHILSI